MVKILIFLSLSFGVFAELSHAELIQKKRSFLVQLVNYIYQKVEGRKLSESELDVLDEHPHIIIPVYLSRRWANKLSFQVCDSEKTIKRRLDDEIDALRHFIGSSILSFKIGETLARKYLTAREFRVNRESEEMDLHNNEMGFNYTNDYLNNKSKTKLKLLINSIKRIGPSIIKEYNLIVLSPQNICQNDNV